MIELPDKKKCYNLPEQVAQNLRNIIFLAEQYKNIDALPAVWQVYKEEFDRELETFGEWTTTFEGWDTTLSTYLANMSSAAVSAIAGQNIAPANVAATSSVTAPSIIETMTGYSGSIASGTSHTTLEGVFLGVVKNGNKLTVALAVNVTRIDAADGLQVASIAIPASVGDNLYPVNISGNNVLDVKKVAAFQTIYTSADVVVRTTKASNTLLNMFIDTTNLSNNTTYYLRYEATFLLGQNLAA